MHETSARGGCADDPEGWDGEEVGGGIGLGIHVNPWLIHVNV